MIVTRIINALKSIIHINRDKQEIRTRVEEIENRFEEEIKDIHNNEFERDFNKLLTDEVKLKQLNLLLSTSPTVWGDEARLEISEKAAVFTAFFNVNSGRIKIGDYTFTGSGVSILAGGHDTELTGFIRRDVEYKEGFDIEIGKGVFIGSNATILGPCIIEDNAVIAAGAVVAPGTRVGAQELYAGIPAKKIKNLNTINDLETDLQKLAEVIWREDGILFFSGWTEKKIVTRERESFLGHWTTEETAVIYTTREMLRLVLIADKEEKTEVKIKTKDEDYHCVQVGRDPIDIDIKTNIEENPVKILFEERSSIFVSGGVM